MDEVGLMVTDITSDGYLKFDEVGGIDRRVLPGKRVCVGRNGLNGVIGVKPIHLTNGDEKTAVPKMNDMYIDIGAESREDALKYVNYGDGINFEGDFKINGKTVPTCKPVVAAPSAIRIASRIGLVPIAAAAAAAAAITCTISSSISSG